MVCAQTHVDAPSVLCDGGKTKIAVCIELDAIHYIVGSSVNFVYLILGRAKLLFKLSSLLRQNLSNKIFLTFGQSFLFYCIECSKNTVIFQNVS